MSKITLYNGDCLEEMKKIPDKSVDLVLCDLPYGTTACKWDCCIDLEKLWKEYKRILKDKGNILLFGDGDLFSAKLMLSKPDWYKYSWIWQKEQGTNQLNAKRQPLKDFENIMVFGRKGQNLYFPQMGEGKPYKSKESSVSSGAYNGNKSHTRPATDNKGTRYPKRVLFFKRDKIKLHETQKPVPLLEYLIKTYTTEGMTVLDNTMGAGSTGVAAKNLNRDFIGIELDKDYFEIAKNRLED